MIEKLTSDDILLATKIKDEMMEELCSAKPFVLKEVESIIKNFWKIQNKDAPKVIFFVDSHREANILSEFLRRYFPHPSSNLVLKEVSEWKNSTDKGHRIDKMADSKKLDDVLRGLNDKIANLGRIVDEHSHDENTEEKILDILNKNKEKIRKILNVVGFKLNILIEEFAKTIAMVDSETLDINHISQYSDLNRLAKRYVVSLIDSDAYKDAKDDGTYGNETNDKLLAVAKTYFKLKNISLTDNYSIVTQNPSVVVFGDENRLHSENTAAYVCEEFSKYCLSGISVNENYILRPDEITPKNITNEANIEVKRVLLNKYGWQKYLDGLGAKLIDTKKDPTVPNEVLELYEYEEEKRYSREKTLRKVLRVVNGTKEPRKEYFIQVRPKFTNAFNAVISTYPEIAALPNAKTVYRNMVRS